jgi:hypothetical protein
MFGVGDSILLGSRGLFLSEDGGQTWGIRSQGLGSVRLELSLDLHFGVTLWLQEGTCYSNGDHPLYRSSDGQSWEPATTKSCDLSFDHDGMTYYRTGIRSEDRGQNWITMNTQQDLGGIYASPINMGEVYATSYSGGTLKSTNYGNSWNKISDQNGGQYPRLFFDSSGTVFYANASYRFGDAGDTWTQCGGNIATAIADQVIAIDSREKMHLFAATIGKGIMESKDGCLNWHTLPGTETLSVNALVLDPDNPDTIYAATDSGAFISSDNGNHWNQINSGLDETSIVYSIVLSKRSGVFASTPYGIYKLESNK